MGDGTREAAGRADEDRPMFETRLREELARPETVAEGNRAWDVPAGFQREHDIIVLVGRVAEGDAASSKVTDSVVDAASSEGLLRSARRCGDDGVATCVARCCKDGGLGCFVMEERESLTLDECFAAVPGRVVVSVAPARAQALADMLDDVEVPYAALGQVGGDRLVLADTDDKTLVDLPLSEL